MGNIFMIVVHACTLNPGLREILAGHVRIAIGQLPRSPEGKSALFDRVIDAGCIRSDGGVQTCVSV
jgi:hypothetical protein